MLRTNTFGRLGSVHLRVRAGGARYNYNIAESDMKEMTAQILSKF
jgi:hypothetical protein